jgi:peptide chain release factor 1
VTTVLDSVQSILDEYSELERRLADPAIHTDQDLVRTLNKRYAALAPTVAAARSWQAAADDLGAARELAPDDESFAAEVPAL